jgi:hypothetical protein
MSTASILAFLTSLGSGYKTYLAAAGLLGLAVYQVSTSQYEPAVQSFLAALASAGLRHAVARGQTDGA